MAEVELPTNRKRVAGTRMNQRADSSKAQPQKPRRDPMLLWTAISGIAACLATMFAGWATWETRRGVAETARSTRASIWSDLLEEYAEPEMLASMKALRKWQQTYPNDFARRFEQLLVSASKSDGSTDALVAELDGHRRRVYKFFAKLRILTEGGVVDVEFVASIWSGGTFTYIKDVLCPMEQANIDALWKLKSITDDDKQHSDQRKVRLLNFYRDIAESSKNSLIN